MHFLEWKDDPVVEKEALTSSAKCVKCKIEPSVAFLRDAAYCRQVLFSSLDYRVTESAHSFLFCFHAMAAMLI